MRSGEPRRRHREAADKLALIGAKPEEALARLLAARSLIADGRRAEGEAELRPAVAFWNQVGATQLGALAEGLLAKIA